jgi:hypothetical protein
MARRLDIELTSSRHDGTWTWRAAGALKPRGVIAGQLLEDGAKVGSVLRVEAEFELEGITVVSVLPPRERVESHKRIEIAPAKSEDSGLVTTSLVSRSGRGPRERPFDGSDRTRPRDRSAASRPHDEVRARPEAAERRRPSRERGAESRPARDGPPRRSRTAAPRPDRVEAVPAESQAPPSTVPAAARRVRSRPERFVPGTLHRDECFSTLPPEQRPVAEQVAAGGMPAVRRALAAEQSAALAAGRPAVGGEAIIALAEQLLSPVRQAVWLDRAEAVVAQLETISLRELRATVLGAAPRDEHGRELLGTIREALKVRLAKLRVGWEGDITRALDEGRVLHALRLSARPPDPGARIPSSLVAPLSEGAGAALTATSSVDRWLALLEAAATSPVRRSIKPAGLPEDPTGAVRHAATLVAGRIPALAPLLGLPMPPPPRPVVALTSKPIARPRAPRARPARGQRPPAGAVVAPEVAVVESNRTSTATPAAIVGALVVEQPQLAAGTISPDLVAVEPMPTRDEGPSPEAGPVEPDAGADVIANAAADTAPAEPRPSPAGTDDEAPPVEVTGSAEPDAVPPEPVVEAVDEV